VVDDDSSVRESLQDLLESAGHETRIFSSAGAFSISDCVGETDCLICDICMPEMDGWALQRRVMLQRPDLPIILMTGHAERALPPFGGSSAPLFQKPFDAQLLLRTIRLLLTPR
jgi:FixJ family two-component response regulator